MCVDVCVYVYMHIHDMCRRPIAERALRPPVGWRLTSYWHTSDLRRSVRILCQSGA